VRAFATRAVTRRCVSLAVSLACATFVASGCANENDPAGTPFVPVHPGVLTVATAFLPAPGFWQGNPPTSGFEAKLALVLAQRLGLERVRVVQVPFASIVSGHLDGADIAISQLTPTGEREKHLDFTTPYLTAPSGVLARVGVEASDLQTLQGLRWVVSTTSTLTAVVQDVIRPSGPPVVTEDRTAALKVLRESRADVLMLDLPVAMGLARLEPGSYRVLGQVAVNHGLAAALPDHSPNLEIVDSAIRGLQADGTIDQLQSRWLGDPGNVPLIRTQP
jgi:polar amino acid transport system substrate-binding protein